LDGVASTRELGRATRERLDQAAADVQAGEVLEIDLTSVRAMTISFADEFIARFIASRAGGDQEDRGLIVRGPTGPVGADLRETLDTVLSRRGVGVLFVDERGRTVPIGGPSWFAATFEEARRLNVFRATDLAGRLELSPQATNGRLKKLSTAGAVLRERVVPDGGGKEFEYRVAAVAG
jgi:hypothetical protein